MRTAKEVLVDRLLMLYAVHCGNLYGRIDGTFKLMKVPFMAELDASERGEKTFSYTYFRFNHGPMTTEVYEDGAALHASGYLSEVKGHKPIALTDSGRILIESIDPLLKLNEGICNYVKESARQYAPLSFPELKQVVYDRVIVWNGISIKIADIPSTATVLPKIESKRARAEFELDEDWVDSLWGVFEYTDDDWRRLGTVKRVAMAAAAPQ